MQPWKTISRRVVQQFGKFLTVESHDIELPDGRIIRDWPWLIAPDFVLVLAQTADGRFICFRQTKYGVPGVTLAPVGGYMDEGEEPLVAARRELLEETGYDAGDWHPLGTFFSHANRGGGHGHLYLALNAHHQCAPHSDDLEEQELLFLTRQQLAGALDSGEFKVVAWTTLVALALRHLEA
jgi:ADP-ribose diphosphatase